MKYLDGSTLEDWLKTRGNTAPASAAVRIADDVLQGLADAHAKGLVHRDIKPGNLWVEAGTGLVKLLDLGLTRSADVGDRYTRYDMIVGTPEYIAPEQARDRPPDPRSDLFSLGAVVYRILIGSSPFARGEGLACVLAARNDPVPTLDHVAPPGLVRFVDRLLAKDPTGRPASAQAAWAELTDAIAQLRDIRSGPDSTGDYSSDAVILLAEPVRSDTVTQVLPGEPPST